MTCRCNECSTVYSEEELELLEDANGFFKGCVICKTDAHLEDVLGGES